MGEKILVKTFALLFNRLLSAWLITDANCSSTQLTVKLCPLSYILWLGVDSSRRCCRMSKTPQFSSFYGLCFIGCFMCCVQGLLTHTAVTCPGKWLVTHLCSHYFIQWQLIRCFLFVIPRYKHNMRCQVTLKLKSTCKKMTFSCRRMHLPNKKNCKKGDTLKVEKQR